MLGVGVMSQLRELRGDYIAQVGIVRLRYYICVVDIHMFYTCLITMLTCIIIVMILCVPEACTT